MRIEKLSRGRNKKIVLAITILILTIGIIYITNSKAKYQVTKSVQIVNGKVNYSLADFNLIAIYLQKSDDGGKTGVEGKYEKASNGDVPTSGYKLNPLGTGTYDSYCIVNGEKNNNGITIEYKNGSVNFYGIKKQGTKCYLYFDVYNISSEQTLTDLGLVGEYGIPKSFDKAACSSGCDITNENGLFKGEEIIDGDKKNTYYFRGTVNNNYVKFANMYWRIIRINGDGSIRMIYNGTTSNASSKNTMINNGETQTFNNNNGNNAYVGYMYGEIISGAVTGEDNYRKTHANTNESDIKKVIDTWYETNIKNKNFEDKISMDAGFCGDRSPCIYNGNNATSLPDKAKYGAGTTFTIYSSYVRTMYISRKPTFDCSNSGNDLYTVNGNRTEVGNKVLKNPVGLITADEVNYAGGSGGLNNNGFWLNVDVSYWTMTPFSFNSSSYAEVFAVLSGGQLNNAKVSNKYVGVRPVINLKADTQFTVTNLEEQKGTSTNPYIVK